MRTTLLSFALCSLLSLSAARAQVTDLAEPAGEGNTDHVVATIDSKYGSILFVEEAYEGERSIGMLTTGSIDLSVLTRQNATPLEIFLLFKDEASPIPDRLLEDHHRSVDREPVDYSTQVGVSGARQKLEFYFVNLYKNLSADANLCNDLVTNFGDTYDDEPPAFLEGGYTVPLAEHGIVGISLKGYDHVESWNTYRNDIAYVDPPLAFQVMLDEVKVNKQTGDSENWSPWGYKRDIAVCVNSWQLDQGFYSSQSSLYEHGDRHEIPFEEWGLDPCSGGTCSFGPQVFGFCYSEQTKNENEPLHNGFKFRVKIFGQKEGGQPWAGPTVDLDWIGEGARYYSTFYGGMRRYKIEVDDLNANDDEKLCKANYLVYMLSNRNWNPNGYGGH